MEHTLCCPNPCVPHRPRAPQTACGHPCPPTMRWKRLTIPWNSLSYVKSQILMQCPQLRELPEAMAYYIQQHMMHRSSRHSWVGISSQGQLTTEEMYTLNQCIATPPRSCKSRGLQKEEHILCYNVMTIEHPHIHDCIIKLRAHPFRYEALGAFSNHRINN